MTRDRNRSFVPQRLAAPVLLTLGVGLRTSSQVLSDAVPVQTDQNGESGRAAGGQLDQHAARAWIDIGIGRRRHQPGDAEERDHRAETSYLHRPEPPPPLYRRFSEP